MNKLSRVILAILGGTNTVVSFLTPIALAILWINLVKLDDWSSWLFFIAGLVATLYRGIKLGGFLDDPDLFKRIINHKKDE